jgi:hypothetical protein
LANMACSGPGVPTSIMDFMAVAESTGTHSSDLVSVVVASLAAVAFDESEVVVAESVLLSLLQEISSASKMAMADNFIYMVFRLKNIRAKIVPAKT